MTELYRAILDAYGRLGAVARVGLVLGVAVLTTLGAMVVVVLLPADHFSGRPAAKSWWHRHAVLRYAVLACKNLVGMIVLPLGVVMALPLIPGPGLVFILIGLSLLDFPGKKAFERRLIGRPAVLRFMNDLRARYGRAPLDLGDA